MPLPPSIHRSLLPAAAAGLGLSLLSALPASAHGVADAGFGSGFAHPLLGFDHLLLLLGVGAAASCIGPSLLLFALVGAVIGAVIGAGGAQLPLAESLAALAVSGVGALILQAQRRSQPLGLAMVGAPVALAVAIHALLHGQEAGGALTWWLGVGLASSAVVACSFLAVRRLPEAWTARLALLLTLAGGVLALAPLS
ncbi:HupE/UreJ family protein [Synechococcus sp. CS-1328]|uniref:HupE/UreJ family protein n=1 Tax=Synechococcus sp. CS-1328 TaxID=2847976 RepID=UPI00223BE15A|nr:HupE/UreJ family protein [Synechococcus sp. CS-1328]MCT0226551.1 HupE/UreJ family protein [Synechococcus sp. CS-1328]